MNPQLEQKLRSKLTYEGVGNLQKTWDDPFHVDFSALQERKYRRYEGVRVYETGLIEVYTNLYNNPDVRNSLRHTVGLDFRTHSELVGLRFRDAAGKAIYKTSLKDNMLLLDWTSRRAFAFAAPWRGSVTKLVHPAAIPTSGENVSTDKPDRKRIKQVREEYKDFIALCTTTYHLAQNVCSDYSTRQYALQTIQGMCAGSVDVSAITDIAQITELGRQFNNNPKLLEQYCRIREEHPFIYFEEK